MRSGVLTSLAEQTIPSHKSGLLLYRLKELGRMEEIESQHDWTLEVYRG